MYKGKRFECRSVEEVKEEICTLRGIADQLRERSWRLGFGGRIDQMVRRSMVNDEVLNLINALPWLFYDNGQPRTAFLGDSDSIIIRADKLAEIVEFLYQTFPSLERVTSYGRAKTVLSKKTKDLRRWKEVGLSRLHLGLESGDDKVLADVKKGVTAEEMIQAGLKVKEAGISLSEYVILGLGGKGRSEQHAEATARVLNRINPDFIRVRTLALRPNTPLEERHRRGEFQLCTPEEILREERRLIEALEVTSEFVSDHITNYLMVEGKLPQDKEQMLKIIDLALEAPPELRARMLQPEELRHI